MARASIPVLPTFADGSLPPLPLLRQWLRQAHEDGEVLGVERIPHGNGLLPVLAELGGFTTLRIFRPDLPRRFTWASPGGHQVQVDNRGVDDDAEHSDSEPITIHGALTPCPAVGGASRIAERVLRRVEAARLADGVSVLDNTMSADWRPALSALSYGGAPPPLRTQSFGLDDGPMRIWNPLPFTRRCVAALPPDGESPPWSVIDHRGAKHPVQVVEGPLGEQWLTELELGPLEVVDVVPYHDPVGGEHWEVSAKVLDNGRVRAEFSDEGRLQRLCFDGVFIPCSEGLLTPLIDGQPASGPTTVRPLEHGPARGRVLVTIEDAAGLLRITYSLHAHDDCLQVAITFAAKRDAEVVMAHPLPWPVPQLEYCGDGAPHIHISGAQRRQDAAVSGLRWLRLSQGDESLAIIGQRPLTVIPDQAQVVVGEGVVFALTNGQRGHHQSSLGQAALSLAVAGRHAGTAEVATAAFHCAEPHDLVAQWVTRPEHWTIELLLVEQQGRSGQAEIFLSESLGPLSEGRFVDADGNRIAELQRNKDGDGWLIPFRPHDIRIVRFR